MARCSLCVVLLFSTFATTLALDYIKCTKWDRQCSQECGTNTCIVKEKCCYFRGKCFYRNRTERTCGPFKCLNGGTRVPLLGKRDTSAVAYGCEVPLPVCSCKAGFSGRCCQNDPCALVKCGYGTVCKIVPVICKKAPCPPKATCVPTKKVGTCPTYPKLGKLSCRQECKDDYDCKGQQKCCDKSCSRVCVDPEPENPCALVDCGPGKICKEVAVPCLVAPCPVSFECVPQDPCNEKICPYGTSCKDMGSGHAECERPGTCPTFPGLITTCQFIPGKNCLSDTECQDGYKCCSKGCGRECIKALTDVFDPCIATTCLVNHVCVSINGQARCIPQPTQVFDPCIATTCLVNHVCVSKNGKAKCIPQQTQVPLDPTTIPSSRDAVEK